MADSTSSMMRDQVTDCLVDFLSAHADEVTRETMKPILAVHSPLILPRSDTQFDNPERVQAAMDRMLAEIERICRQHEFSRILVLFRKIPHEITIDMIRLTRDLSRVPHSEFDPLYTEAVLFGTNCLLQYANRAASFERIHERYTFKPTEKELGDAFRLMLLCLAHRQETFRMNSLLRRSLTSPVSFEHLLSIYNRRLRLHAAEYTAKDRMNIVVGPQLIARIPRHERIWTCYDGEGRSHSMIMSNFHSVMIDSRPYLRRFEYLDCDEFTKLMGVPFQTWCKVWIGLNLVALHNIPQLMHDSSIAQMTSDELGPRLERGHDYCETALGGGHPEGFWRTCHEILKMYDPEDKTTLEECRTVVDRLTFSHLDGDIRFPEQPFVFYPVSTRVLLWDYFRHAGLLRCIARNLSSNPMFSGSNRKGEVLERLVVNAVREELPEAHSFKTSIKIKNARQFVWEIDVAFIFRKILFLIEAKNQQKMLRYYFEGRDLERGANWLEDRDEKLRQYASIVRNKWKEDENISGAIYIVCSEEAEFMPSYEPSLWLDIENYPRVCMLFELIQFLKEADLDSIQRHPNFVPFGA